VRPCPEIRINRFEGRDEKQISIIFAFVNRDCHTCRKSASSLVSPSTTNHLSDSSTNDRIQKPRDHQDRFQCRAHGKRPRLDQVKDCAYDVLSLFRCLRFDRCIAGNRCDGLIILQAENLATSESRVSGNLKRGWVHGIEDIQFSERYRLSHVWRISFRFVIMAKDHCGIRLNIVHII
jgi:hypothetical protein